MFDAAKPSRLALAMRRGRWPLTGALVVALLAASWALVGLIDGVEWWLLLIGFGTLLLVFPAFLRTVGVPRGLASLLDLVLFAFCFGIAEELLPPAWDDFLAYNEAMWASDQLTVGPEAREIARFLFDFNPALRPVLDHYRVLTSMVMPVRLREQFGLPPANERSMAAFRRTTGLIRRVHPWLPRRLAYLPAYVEARRRLRGLHEPDFVTGALNRLMLGQTRLVS